MKGTYVQIAEMTGLKKWKVQLVLGNNTSQNIHRVTDDEMAIILHAAAEIGYVNPGHGGSANKKVKEVTLDMVAKRAGVSTSAVHAALKARSRSISPDTKKHILRIVKELGYKPTHEMQINNFYSRKE